MDKGLKLQVELTKKGEKIFSRLQEIVKDLKENDKMYYLMANGISLCVMEEYINIHLIFASQDNEQMRGLCIIQNPYMDRVIAKEAIRNYLVNNPEYSFDMESDIVEDLAFKSAKDNYSTIHFWFN